MGTARLAVYLIGLLVVVAAVWVFLTQTPWGRTVPASVALALILLLVGIGVMASARSINDTRSTRRVVHDYASAPAYVDTPRYVPPAPAYETVVPPVGETETVVDERRYD
jgi:hypothetical protein